MEKFLALPSDKQSSIISAALHAFGHNGYKKASTADIAEAAGISKAMVFHYFGTKKTLYLYLCDYCSKRMKAALNEVRQAVDGDFFEIVRYSIIVKITVLKSNPYMLEFLKSMYSEADQEISEDLRRYHEMVTPFQRKVTIDDDGAVKFKAGINPMQVMKMLNWMGAGCIEDLAGTAGREKLDEIAAAFFDCLEVMKNNFYKEEYL